MSKPNNNGRQKNWQLYEKKRKNEGKAIRKKKSQVRRYIRETLELLGKSGASDDRLVCGVLILLCRAEFGLSYRGLATRLDSSEGFRRMCNLSYAPSKSALHDMAKAVATAGKDFMSHILSMMAYDGTDGNWNDLHGDSTGFGLRKYVEWNHAKHGDGHIKAHDFVKLHLITAVNGMILAFSVTGAHAHDSPIFREMFKDWIRPGCGIVALDAAYYAAANCDIIVESGRVPVIKPKKNSTASGYSAIGKMTAWYKNDRDSFLLAYGKRNLAESVFSSIKERTGAIVRAKSLSTQTAELFARVLYYNLTV